MRVGSTGTGTLQLASNARLSAVRLNAGYEQVGGKVTVNSAAPNTRTVEVANDFTLRGGTLTVATSTLPSSIGGRTVSGSLKPKVGRSPSPKPAGRAA